MLCSKLHCQKGFNVILFSYEIARETRVVVDETGWTGLRVGVRAIRADPTFRVHTVNVFQGVPRLTQIELVGVRVQGLEFEGEGNARYKKAVSATYVLAPLGGVRRHMRTGFASSE